MNQGIKAIKYNFSNAKKKTVVVTLSSDGKSLRYSRHVRDKSCWDQVKGSGKLAFSQIAMIFYGGMTSTFSFD